MLKILALKLVETGDNGKFANVELRITCLSLLMCVGLKL